MTPIPVILSGGTYSRRNGWFRPGAEVRSYLESQGMRVIYVVPWSTELGGHEGWRRTVFAEGDPQRLEDHWPWQAGGEAFADEAEHRRDEFAGAFVIAHSHGVNPVLYGCASGVRVRGLISLSSPVRPGDMAPIYRAAAMNIGCWKHAYTEGDLMQWAGTGGDGILGYVTQNKWADDNESLGRIDHGAVLFDPAIRAKHWPGWVQWMREH